MKILKTILPLITFIFFTQLISCQDQPKKKVPVERVDLQNVNPIDDIEPVNEISSTPDWKVVDEFYEAISANDTEKVKEMFATKIPEHYQFKNKITPLQAVIWSADNVELAKLFVNAGYERNGKEESDVLDACEYKRPEILKYLILETGASKDNGAFEKAGFYQFYEGAKFLLLQGAKQGDGDVRGKLWIYLEAVKRSDYEVLNALKLNEEELNSNDCDGQTALITAIKNNNAAMVEYLLKKGVNKDKPETFDCGDDIHYGKKPLYIAKKLDFKDIAALLNRSKKQ